MSGRYSRNKGARAERELFALLGDDLGVTIQRNLVQSRAGGCDSDAEGFPYAVECKNVKVMARPAWWFQACEQAERAGKLPALFYRKPKGRGDDLRDCWHAVLPAPFATHGCIVAAPPGHTLATGPAPTKYPLGLPMGYRAAVEVMRQITWAGAGPVAAQGGTCSAAALAAPGVSADGTPSAPNGVSPMGAL